MKTCTTSLVSHEGTCDVGPYTLNLYINVRLMLSACALWDPKKVNPPSHK
jgi:hypothetical protein